MKKLNEIKNGTLYYNGYNLVDLAKKYGTPLKVTFLDIIKDHITSLKEEFSKAIKDLNYNGKFIYLNANKANYGGLEVLEAYKHSCGLETSSHMDLQFTRRIYDDYKETEKPIYSNGYKPDYYINEIIDMHKSGYQITDIIDSVNEYEALKKADIDLPVGLRIHLEALYAEEDEEVKNDRFGLPKEDIEYILNDIKNTKLKLTTIHFHQRGFDYEEDKFKENFELGFKWYAKAQKLYDSVVNFDMGGGTPLPLVEGFDYYKWACDVVSFMIELSNKYGVKQPNLISENGKFSQKDATIDIYKVVGKKHTDEYPWYIIDGSPMLSLAEMMFLGEPLRVEAINNLDGAKERVRIGGLTCDCDDILFDKKKGYYELPKEGELYIGFIGTGSYQNSMNGKGGVHHCLMPEETDVVINDGKEFVRSPLQTLDDVLKLNKYIK